MPRIAKMILYKGVITYTLHILQCGKNLNAILCLNERRVTRLWQTGHFILNLHSRNGQDGSHLRGVDSIYKSFSLSKLGINIKAHGGPSFS
jgi:hypothetical protein